MAMVVKYSDSVLKGVATGLSVVLSCLLSSFFFDFTITVQFVVGATMVLYGVSLYLKKPKQEYVEIPQFEKMDYNDK